MEHQFKSKEKKLYIFHIDVEVQWVPQRGSDDIRPAVWDYICTLSIYPVNTFGKFWICLNFADYMYSWIYTYFSNIQGEGISRSRGFTGRQIFMADIETRTSGSFKVSNWDILELRSQKLEIRSFSFLNSLNYGTLNQKNQNYQIK